MTYLLEAVDAEPLETFPDDAFEDSLFVKCWQHVDRKWQRHVSALCLCEVCLIADSRWVHFNTEPQMLQEGVGKTWSNWLVTHWAHPPGQMLAWCWGISLKTPGNFAWNEKNILTRKIAWILLGCLRLSFVLFWFFCWFFKFYVTFKGSFYCCFEQRLENRTMHSNAAVIARTNVEFFLLPTGDFPFSLQMVLPDKHRVRLVRSWGWSVKTRYTCRRVCVCQYWSWCSISLNQFDCLLTHTPTVQSTTYIWSCHVRPQFVTT